MAVTGEKVSIQITSTSSKVLIKRHGEMYLKKKSGEKTVVKHFKNYTTLTLR